MKKTFDELCAAILGEMLTQDQQQNQQQNSPTTPAQPNQPQQPQQQTTQQQSPNIKELATQLAGINKAEEIEAILNKLVNPNAAN